MPERAKRPPVTVAAEVIPGPPLDVDAWLADLVQLLMELEGIRPAAGVPPMRSVG